MAALPPGPFASVPPDSRAMNYYPSQPFPSQFHQRPQNAHPPVTPQQPPMRQHHQARPSFQQHQQPTLINLRLILNRDEVNYLFGFDGVLLNQLRQQTGANINLTEPVAYEQVLTLNGPLDIVFKAFSLICRKLWDFMTEISGPNLVLRLAVPASQCGSIIGKQGAKVKEIRDLTGANIQVSQDGLPDSTERCVEVSGTGESCLQCTYHICCVLQEAPIRGELVPYVPKSALGPTGPSSSDGSYKPVFLCGDKAYVIEGDYAVPADPDHLRKELAKTSLGEMAESLATLNNQSQTPVQEQPPHMDPLTLIQALSSRRSSAGTLPQTSREMSVGADLVGFIIGKAGSKISEIQRISGAQLHVSREVVEGHNPNGERVITISGTEESILLAQFLIQSNIDMALKDRSSSTSERGGMSAPTEDGPMGTGGPRFQNDPRRTNGSYRGGRGGSHRGSGPTSRR